MARWVQAQQIDSDGSAWKTTELETTDLETPELETPQIPDPQLWNINPLPMTTKDRAGT